MLRVAAFILPSRAPQSTGLSQSNITHKDGDKQIHMHRKHILGQKKIKILALFTCFPPITSKLVEILQFYQSPWLVGIRIGVLGNKSTWSGLGKVKGMV